MVYVIEPDQDPLEGVWAWNELHVALSLRRRQLGLSQAALASLMHLAQGTIAARELGYHRQGAGVKVLAEWTQALKVTVDIEIVDGIISVKLTEGRKNHGKGRTAHAPGRRPKNETETQPA